jgi:hypothetical protein
MKRRLAACLLSLALAGAAALLALAPAGHHSRPSLARTGELVGTELLAFVDRVNGARARPPETPGQPCSVEGSGCVRGCTVFVASARSRLARPQARLAKARSRLTPNGQCEGTTGAAPCRELIAAGTKRSHAPDGSFCSQSPPTLRERLRRKQGKPPAR